MGAAIELSRLDGAVLASAMSMTDGLLRSLRWRFAGRGPGPAAARSVATRSADGAPSLRKPEVGALDLGAARRFASAFAFTFAFGF